MPDEADQVRNDAAAAAESLPRSDTPDVNAAREQAESGNVQYKIPEFAPMEDAQLNRSAVHMDRFYDVHVPIWAELGRVEMPLGDLMKLDEGAVLRLNRPVGEPVDLVSQGVKLARGEVVVIDDCFAVRIKEIEKSSK
jgi:flagellar motor switch protein FliN/FliY